MLGRSGAEKPEMVNVTASRGGGSGCFRWGAVSGAKVTIGAGVILAIGGYYKTPAVTVSCGGTRDLPHLIILEGDPQDATSFAVSAVSVEEDSFTGHTATRYRRPLYRVCLIAGRVVWLPPSMNGLIDLTAWFAP